MERLLAWSADCTQPMTSVVSATLATAAPYSIAGRGIRLARFTSACIRPRAAARTPPMCHMIRPPNVAPATPTCFSARRAAPRT